MRTLLLMLVIVTSVISCKTKSTATSGDNMANTRSVQGDTVKIANNELEYEVIIIDPGFGNWLNSRAFPRGYHSESYLEGKNQWYVQEWNRRVLQPQYYDRNLYEMSINYDPAIHYGYEVNYLIYNYMVYFQNTFKQQLYGFVPPR
jgi:hypothetical protein